MLAGVAHVTVGVATPLICNSQLTSIFVPPDSRSARNRVHSPPPPNVLKEVSVVFRAFVVTTTAGSTLRPSGCQLFVSGAPAAGVVTLRYTWISPLLAAASKVMSKPESAYPTALLSL